MHNMVTVVDNTGKKRKLYKVGKNKMIRLVLKNAVNSVVYFVATGRLCYILSFEKLWS